MNWLSSKLQLLASHQGSVFNTFPFAIMQSYHSNMHTWPSPYRPVLYLRCRLSLVVRWLRTCLQVQGTQVWSLVWKNPHYHKATKPTCHSYWISSTLVSVLGDKKSHCTEKPVHGNEEEPPLSATRESPHCSSEDPVQPKLNTQICALESSAFFKFRLS